MASRIPASVAGLGLVQNDGEVSPAETESLFNMSGHGHLRSVFGRAIVPGHDPHEAGAIVNLERASPQRAKRIGDASGDADLLAGVAAGILIQFGDANAWRT